MDLAEALLAALGRHPEGLSMANLKKEAQQRRLDAWKARRVLKALEGRGLVHGKGATRARVYFAGPAPAQPELRASSSGWLFSPQAQAIVDRVSRPIHERLPCSYERSLLDGYRPNRTFYLQAEERERLRALGKTPDANRAAGTWARHMLERLLIDLSWNSSRLEGNTFSLLDTERLFKTRQAPEGHQALEVQMLLNHKQAIEYLVEGAGTLELEPRVIRTLHGMLSENLLSDPADEGRLRRDPVAIQSSTYLPLSVPQQVEEIFIQLLRTAHAIDDPFEQSFFLLVHMPYLQPFIDVNKRTSRLAANLPLLQHNLQPLSFVDLPEAPYTLSTLAIYEERRIEPLRDVFLWAYQRSVARYRALATSMGEPDAFRLQYREPLREVVRTIVLELPAAKKLTARLAAIAKEHAPPADRPRFQAAAAEELKNLNEGTFHRYGLRPSEFERWQQRSSASSPRDG